MAYLRIPFCSPYKLFWPLAIAPTRPSDVIHRAYAGHVWRMHGLKALPLALLYSVVWPIPFAWLALKHTWQLGGEVKAASGKGRIRQLLEQFWVALCYSISPKKYYVFELFRPERFPNARDYIARYELKGGLHNLLESRIESPSRRILNDKVAFYWRCRSHNLATIPTFLVVERDGAARRMSDFEGGLPHCDLFIKPVRGRGGRGCERWRWREGAGYVDQDGIVWTERELMAHVREAAANGAMMVQAVLSAHNDLRGLAMNVLTSCRIMTVRNEAGGFEATHAVFKSSTRPDAIVDNFHRGGIVSRVDMKSGRLGPASDAGVGRPCVWYERHPLTGEQIAGRQLPYWKETTDLVCRAHAAFPDRITVGWDVSITGDGPVLLEGNVQSGCDMIQRTHDIPAGAGRLAECYAYHIRQALAREVSPSFRVRMQRGAGRRRARLAARLGLTRLAVGEIKRVIRSELDVPELSSRTLLPSEAELVSLLRVPGRVVGRALRELAEENAPRR